ncbi:MAG: LacI family DNA-binding transcriptional regulator [Victivallaceae bacterium]|jgi:DNA-binding LacI/PurR family transcriptional regulator
MYSLDKIAKDIGVSKATVSLILSGKAEQSRISAETEEKVKNYCRQINYLPNIHAQRMNQKLVKNIGILIETGENIGEDSPLSEFNIAQIIGGIAIASEKAGYSFSVRIYRDGMDEQQIFNSFRNKEIAGLIYYGFKIPEAWKKVFAAENRHVTGIGIYPEPDISSVNIDNFEVSYRLTEYLLRQGRRRFIYLGGMASSYPGTERYNGFKAALQDNQIEFSEKNLFRCDFNEFKANEIVKKFFGNKKNHADAVVCANDAMAIGATLGLRESGFKVPQDIAVTGADNISLGRYFSPALTTFDNRPRLLGEKAFEALMGSINGNGCGHLILKSELIIRQSA